MRATITDIARESGVSTATVDRVLNDRPGVKTVLRARVLCAAERLGYLVPAPAKAADPVAVSIVLPGGTNTFIALLAQHFETIAGLRGDVRLRIHSIEGFNPDALAAKLDELQGQTDAIGVVALDHPTVREALRAVAVAGTPVVTLVSDISNVPRLDYIGIDNRAAGRLAGHLLGRFIGPGEGQVAVFAGSLSYRGHEEREMGLRHVLAEDFPGLKIVEFCESRDDAERTYRDARALLERFAGLAGIYNIGAGNRGIARALEEAGRDRSVVYVGHELTPHTRRFLVSGTMDAVIDQNPRVEARDALDCLVQAVRGTPGHPVPPVRIQAIFKENIPYA